MDALGGYASEYASEDSDAGEVNARPRKKRAGHPPPSLSPASPSSAAERSLVATPFVQSMASLKRDSMRKTDAASPSSAAERALVVELRRALQESIDEHNQIQTQMHEQRERSTAAAVQMLENHAMAESALETKTDELRCALATAHSAAEASSGELERAERMCDAAIAREACERAARVAAEAALAGERATAAVRFMRDGNSWPMTAARNTAL